ncbi:MAG: putative DNA binding domain-containing protein [Hydrogenophaga sp.]|uniref:Fic family protein n=1 Tax=Hydrogenophaga sp. TaxID=1904254 RepID=UPI00271E3E9D|nr:RNA-binding domain-containing protein [Hydrogenophaga sp.]MDO9568586.1 putative DNA binding domain-containing protein [Hydrogenophaga sp.]
MNETPLTEAELLERIALGEHTRQQFKRTFNSPDALAAELAAFANSGGGTLLIGVADDGTITGLSAADIRHLNQMLSNASSQHVRPPIHPITENIKTHAGLVMVVTVPNGLAKPYLDNQGRIWVKQGADKRHVTAREEMQRMFQSGGLVYADVVPVTGTTSADLDEPAFRRYLAQHYAADTALAELPLDALLQNLGLGNGLELTLAGLMLFGRNPLRWCPAFTIKAVAFFGNSIADSHYQDSQDFSGTLPAQYADALAFIKRNLRRVQGNQGFNSPGILEVPEIALQELLVNALVHRDYFTSASIRILVFRDHIDIISPGALPDSLSIEDIRRGKSNRRNPTLSEHAFRLLPYRGMGSGIPRALGEWPQIELISEVSGNQFTARVQRPKAQWAETGNPVIPQVADPVAGQATEQATEQVTEQVRRLCVALEQEAQGTKELMQSLNLKHRPSFLQGYLNPALKQHLVEMTQPDSPRSPTQKYRLTEQGKALLK